MADLGFIGLGKMGLHMARNLIRANHHVTIHNRSRSAVDQLVAEGGHAASNPADVARAARILFTCLTTPDVLETVIRAALEGARPGDIFVDHSTIGVGDAKRLAEICAARQVHFIDAPISGGPPGAKAGTLTIMCGGDPEIYDRVLPLLQIEGKRLHLLGPVGSGTVAKLCNQLLVGVHAAALAEAYVLGVKAGLDPEHLHEIISNATGGSKQIDRNIPGFIFPGKFDAQFSIGHLHKDVALAVTLGKEHQVRLMLGAMTQQLLEEARAAGHTESDIAALIRPLEDLAGVKVRA